MRTTSRFPGLLAQWFDQAVLDHAETLLTHRAIDASGLVDSGIVGRVRCDGASYPVRLRVHWVADTLIDFTAHCECRVRRCVHAAAMLLAYLAQDERVVRSRRHDDGRHLLAVPYLPGLEQRWLTFRLGIRVGGTTVDILPAVVDALKDNARHDDGHEWIGLRLTDDTPVRVPWSRLEPIVGHVLELVREGLLDEHDEPSVSPARPRAMAAAVPRGGPRDAYGMSTILAAAHELGRSNPRDLPPHLPLRSTVRLRAHQHEGIAWLGRLARARVGGVLADEMGLGKTLQCLGHLAIEHEHGRLERPTLVVTPKSVIHHWVAEARRFVPQLRVLALEGRLCRRQPPLQGHYDLVVTSYGVVLHHQKWLRRKDFELMILDEAHIVKNWRGRSRTALEQIAADRVLCLTGTPLENDLGELWSIVSLAVPGLLGSRGTFAVEFRRPIEKHDDRDRLATLRRRLAPFVLRRTKQSVTPELAAKTHVIHRVRLEGEHRDLYEAVRTTAIRDVRTILHRHGLGKRVAALQAILRLRQVCCDPRLIPMPRARAMTTSSKLSHLLSLVEKLTVEGHRVIVFSQFAAMIRHMSAALATRRIEHVELLGSTTDRAGVVGRFQRGDTPVMLISLRAGGSGLSLTAADTVIHYEPWWNPAVMKQATDRAHRIGQAREVTVYELLASGTVEERLRNLQKAKQLLFRRVLDGPPPRPPPPWFSEEELLRLLEPVGEGDDTDDAA